MRSLENITQHEFIGMDTKVTNSTNSSLIGLNGTIVNETKSMFAINTKKGMKWVSKENSSWKFSIDGQETTISGSKIHKRPFDRIGEKL